MSDRKDQDEQVNTSRSRLLYIDAFRGCACLWVLFHHTFGYMPIGHGRWYVPLHFLVVFSNCGWLGVSAFLVLSGFCLCYPLVARNETHSLRVNVKQFAIRRARRILPPYYIAAGLLIGLETLNEHHLGNGWNWHAALNGGRKDFIMHLLMIHNLSPVTICSISPAFWSLALETQLYTVFPLLITIMARRGLRVMLAITFLISIAWQLYCFHHLADLRLSLTYSTLDAVWYHALPARAFEFALGMTAAVFVARPRRNQSRIAFVLILVPIFPAFWFITNVSRFGPLLDQTWGVIFAASLVLMSRVPDTRFLHSRLFKSLVWLGTISYSIYLMHQPLISIFLPSLFHAKNTLATLFLVGWLRLPFLIFVGFLFHLAFERPFMLGKPKKSQAETATAVSPAP